MSAGKSNGRSRGWGLNVELLATNATNSVLRSLRRDALEILRHALDDVDPEQAVATVIERRGDYLYVLGKQVPIVARPIYVLAIGKASTRMAKGVLRVLRPESGLLVAEKAPSPALEGFQTVLASHPLPDEGSLRAGEAALRIADGLRPGDVLIVLLSVGASAMFEASRVPLGDLRDANTQMLRSGLDVRDLNEVRKGLSDVKGGRLAERAAGRGATVVGLILSDIVGSPIEDIGSGPTAPGSSRGERAKEILVRHGLWDRMPVSVRHSLAEAASATRPRLSAPTAVHNFIVADNVRACEAARREAERRGYAAHILTTSLEGEARQVGPVLAADAIRWKPRARRIAVVAGGETTVTVRGRGLGGRNQELALAAARILEGRSAVLLSCGTDGADGNTDAAGAIADGETMSRARSLRLDPKKFLEANDSFAFFQALGDLIVTGPTGTNVADIQIVLEDRSRPLPGGQSR